MSSITGAVSELNTIIAEQKRLRIQMKKLNDRKKNLESVIINFLHEKDQPGLKYQGVAIVSEEKEVFKRKKKDEKKEDIKETLRNLGVKDLDKAYDELMNSMKGEADTSVKLKIKALK